MWSKICGRPSNLFGRPLAISKKIKNCSLAREYAVRYTPTMNSKKEKKSIKPKLYVRFEKAEYTNK